AVVELCAVVRMHASWRMRIRLIELRMVSFQFRTCLWSKTLRSSLALRSDGKTAAVAEGLGRNLNARSRLLALVLGAVHHSDHAPHHFDVETMIGGDPLGRVRILHVVFEDRVKNLVGRQRVTVFLIGP